MYATQIIWNFKTTSTAYLVKLEERRSLQNSQLNYTLSSFIVFFNNSGYVTAANQTSTCTLLIKCVLRGRLQAVQVYIEAKRKVSHSTTFSELSRHFQTYKLPLSPMNGICIC